MTLPHDLLDDLRNSPTDLARVVEAVVRDRLPNVIIPPLRPLDPGNVEHRSTGLRSSPGCQRKTLPWFKYERGWIGIEHVAKAPASV